MQIFTHFNHENPLKLTNFIKIHNRLTKIIKLLLKRSFYSQIYCLSLLCFGSEHYFLCRMTPLAMQGILIILLYFIINIPLLGAQISNQVKGLIINDNSKPLANVHIAILNTSIFVKSGEDGSFILKNIPAGNHSVEITLQKCLPQRFNISIQKNEVIDLGKIVLEYDFSSEEQRNGIISLTEDDISNDEIGVENTSGLLQASRDIFQNRAAFDFGQAFFRVRGYDSQNAAVLINGILMNKLFNGRPQWNNWGGLNDVTRNQELTMGLAPSDYTFGGILGTTNITMRPSKQRSGLRVSGSYSNRTYSGRGMVTYSSGTQKNKLTYTVSASRRWADQGYLDGTPYDAYSVFGGLEFKLNQSHSLNTIAIISSNKRGASTAITERTFNALGRSYNPFWGEQDNNIRNARLRTINEPIFMLSHFYEGERTTLTTSVSYQFGKQGRSRLDYANAPNPNPNYWRYLPSITEKPQIDWGNLYDANRTTVNLNDAGAARYILYQDRTDDTSLSISSILNTEFSERFSLDLGGAYKNLTSDNFGLPLDLLGAQYYADVNQFTLIDGLPARNDINGGIQKSIEDRIKYNYAIDADQINAFAQLQLNFKKANFFISGSFTSTNYQRNGKFLNESFENNSFGKSEQLTFADFGIKGGVTYKVTGRHFISMNAGYLTKAPTVRNSFVNSRENNSLVPNLKSEVLTSGEISYIARLPSLKARLTGYYSTFEKGTDINFFFAQIGSGTDFFQEVVTNINKRHIGAELGLIYQMSATTKAFLVAAYEKHTYTDNANVGVNFDVAGYNQDLINETGFKDLGETKIKGLKVANGPQQAYSIGVEYRDPKRWWIGATANYLSHAYIDTSTITRTADFFINPETQLPFEVVDMELANELLKQERFDGFYLLNLTGGKSWRINNHFLSLFVSVNNVFEELYKTGGYEQSRTANYNALLEDTANGELQRSFGNKYWFGFGRTYFINLAFNF